MVTLNSGSDLIIISQLSSEELYVTKFYGLAGHATQPQVDNTLMLPNSEGFQVH